MSQKITLKGASHLAYLSPHSYSTLTQLLGSPAALKKWESQNQLGHCAKPTQWKTIIRNLPCLAILLYTKNQPMQAYLSLDVLPLLCYPPTNIFRIKKCHCLPSIIMSWVPPPLLYFIGRLMHGSCRLLYRIIEIFLIPGSALTLLTLYGSVHCSPITFINDIERYI